MKFRALEYLGHRFSGSLPLALACAAAAPSNAIGDHRLTAQQACRVLIATASENHLAVDKPGRYYCESTGSESSYFVIDLHYFDETLPEGWEGSTKVGDYGVRKRGRAVFVWDTAEDTPASPTPLHAHRASRHER